MVRALAGLQGLDVSEDPQDQAMVSLAEACTAAARGKPEDALRRAREALAHADALGISFGTMRWASLRENSTPYHLAHGLLDHAGYLTRHGHPDACRPLLDRADALERAQPVLGV